MTSVIGFMTSILFCRAMACNDSMKCNGEIDCPWLSPHDEANCSQQCSSSRYGPIPCDCNKPGNMTCNRRFGRSGYVCYRKSGKFLVLCFFL